MVKPRLHVPRFPVPWPPWRVHATVGFIFYPNTVMLDPANRDRLQFWGLGVNFRWGHLFFVGTKA